MTYIFSFFLLFFAAFTATAAPAVICVSKALINTVTPLGVKYVAAVIGQPVTCVNCKLGLVGVVPSAGDRYSCISNEPNDVPPVCSEGSQSYNGDCVTAGNGSPGYRPASPASPHANPPPPPAGTGTGLGGGTGGGAGGGTPSPVSDSFASGFTGAVFAAAAGAAAFVGAPPLLVAGLSAVALHAAVDAFFGGKTAPAPSVDAAYTGPVKINFLPLPIDTLPTTSDNAAPTINVTQDGVFAPSGGGSQSGNGTAGGWSPPDVNGDTFYTPPATGANPTPLPTASITDGGHTFSGQTNPNSQGQSDGAVTVTRHADGSVLVTNLATIPVTDGNGNQTTAKVAKTTTYLPSGNVSAAAPTVVISPVLGDGQPSNGGVGLTPAPSTAPSTGIGGSPVVGGTGATSGTNVRVGDGSGTSNNGGCGSGGSCESTQLANKGLLTGILNWLTEKADTPASPTAKTAAEVKAGSLSKTTPVFSSLTTWQLPAHSSTCPTSSFSWRGQQYFFDAHCTLVTQHFAALRAVMTAAFSIAAVLVVLRA